LIACVTHTREYLMKHSRFTYLGQTYILTGNCITVYNTNGKKLSNKFFNDCHSALIAFADIYTSLSA
jgi:hypothetical protein